MPSSSSQSRRHPIQAVKRNRTGRRPVGHGLRHTHAPQLRADGVDIAVIRRQLGHTSIVTTVRYLDHLAPTAVIRAIRERQWLASPMVGTRDLNQDGKTDLNSRRTTANATSGTTMR
jgi:integrase